MVKKKEGKCPQPVYEVAELLKDIRYNLMVCELEGWEKMEYINGIYKRDSEADGNTRGRTKWK